MSLQRPETVRLADGYVYRWKDPDWIEVEVAEVRRKSDAWHAEMAIRSRVPGLEPKHLTETTHNLSAVQNRTALARTLADRYALSNGANWGDYLEMACVLTVRAEREGQPFRKVGMMVEDDRPDLWLLNGYIRLHHSTSIWADGATGKSTLGVLWAVAVKTGVELAGFVPNYSGPVIWLDWESDEWDIDDTIKSICNGHNLGLVEFDYRREVWPLTQTFRQIANQVQREGTALVVIDSAGYAIGGDSEKAADVLDFTRAVRALNTSVLIIDHVRKDDPRGKQFGSVYKFNEVRMGFELMRQQEEGSNESIITVKCQKANKGGWPKPVFLKATFGDHLIQYEVTDPPRSGDALTALSPKERIRRVLREAADLMNAEEICDAINEGIAEKKRTPLAQVKSRLSELVKAKVLYATEARGYARRFGTLSERPDDEARA